MILKLLRISILCHIIHIVKLILKIPKDQQVIVLRVELCINNIATLRNRDSLGEFEAESWRLLV